MQRKPISVYRNESYDLIPYLKYNAIASSDITFHPTTNQAFISSFFHGVVRLDDVTKAVDDMVFETFKEQVNMPVASDNSSRLLGYTFDSQWNAWFALSLAPKQVGKFDSNMNFTYYEFPFAGYNNNRQSVIDPWNTKWFATSNYGVVAFNEQNNKVERFFAGNSEIPSNWVNSVAIDKNNQIWVGAFEGLRVIPVPQQFVNSSQLNISNIVIMDDGKPEELFYQQNILYILVDGANNKWVSVENAGVFYISSNGQETYRHFTTENSPLPSNTIHTITMNSQTGEIFFASSEGVVSFQNKISIDSRDDLSDIIAYPNPLRPEQADAITVTGLMSKANIKVTDTAGNLVFETTVPSGSWVWNTQNFSGRRVASGVYFIHVSSEDAVHKKTIKVAIIR